MKKYIPATIVLLLGFILFSCRQNEHAAFSSCKINNGVTTGVWKISSYTVDGIEQKGKFEQYRLSFSNTNGIVVTDSLNTYLGKWSVTTIDGSDDTMASDTDLILKLAPASGLSAISKDWMIDEASKERLILGNGSGHEILVLTKKQ